MDTDVREAVTKDLTDAMAKAVDRLSAQLRQAERGAERLVRQSREATRELVHDAGEFAHDVGEGTRRAAVAARREVREHPLASLAIGAAVGTLFGILIAQRKS